MEFIDESNSNRMGNLEEEFNESMENTYQLDEKKETIHKKNVASIADLVSKNENEKNHLKNLYQNIGTRVSKLREINENYKGKIKGQKQEIFIFNEKIEEKQKLLEVIREAKRQNNKKLINQKYQEVFKKNTLVIEKKQISASILVKDPLVNKIYVENEKEVTHLQDNLNGYIKKIEDISSQINLLRVENDKLKNKLKEIISLKDERTNEMDKISEEANKYLAEKDTVNKNLIDLNQKIDEQKQLYELEMQNINKMIDNTKKIKQFHQNMAVEKFSKPNSNTNGQTGTGNRIADEKNKLDDLAKEFSRKKKITIHLNFTRFILFKKQQELQKIVEEVKSQTGIESLDSLSKYLEMSTKTNSLFESDIKNLNQQKIDLEKEIIRVKQELQNSQCFLNDTSSKKLEYLDKIKSEIKVEENLKREMDKKLFTMNRVIDVLSVGFKKNSQSSLTRCMDFIERKILEVVQTNNELNKEETITIEEKIVNQKNGNVLEKVSDNLFIEELPKVGDNRKNSFNGNLDIENIKENANDLVNTYIRKYEKLN